MIRVSYRKDADRWVGVLKIGKTTLVECGHTHHNRDFSTSTYGEAAQVCARAILDGARRPATAEHRANQLRNAWLRLTTGAGFTFSDTVIEATKQAAAERASAYLILVEQVRRHPDLNARPAQPTQPQASRTPAAVEELPAGHWMF